MLYKSPFTGGTCLGIVSFSILIVYTMFNDIVSQYWFMSGFVLSVAAFSLLIVFNREKSIYISNSVPAIACLLLIFPMPVEFDRIVLIAGAWGSCLVSMFLIIQTLAAHEN